MQMNSKKIDTYRELIIPGNRLTTIEFCVNHFLAFAEDSIEKYGRFLVALSGGSTPNAIYANLDKMDSKIDWSKVHLFWGDERSVPPNHPDSNYYTAMEAGIKNLPIPKRHIHRMVAEKNIEIEAKKYENTIKRERIKPYSFDLVMLGVGEDGHIASLFPNTDGIQEKTRWVIANKVPQKNTTRMTITYPCIEAARAVVIYAIGKTKQSIVSKILHSPPTSRWPASQIGNDFHPALWIVDQDAIAIYSDTKDSPP